jgi:hypothetical protein
MLMLVVSQLIEILGSFFGLESIKLRGGLKEEVSQYTAQTTLLHGNLTALL